MKSITVKELIDLCQEQVKKGNGNKEILLSNDDELNGMHNLFYGFTEDVEGNDEYKQYGKDANKKYVLLG